jgi:hypothetical protein
MRRILALVGIELQKCVHFIGSTILGASIMCPFLLGTPFK